MFNVENLAHFQSFKVFLYHFEVFNQDQNRQKKIRNNCLFYQKDAICVGKKIRIRRLLTKIFDEKTLRFLEFYSIISLKKIYVPKISILILSVAAAIVLVASIALNKFKWTAQTFSVSNSKSISAVSPPLYRVNLPFFPQHIY